jgi:hypothetical protein
MGKENVNHLQELFDIEYLAESRHIENCLYQRLKVTDDKFSSLSCNVLVQSQEHTKA